MIGKADGIVMSGLVSVIRPYVIAEIQAAADYLGQPATLDMLETLKAMPTMKLMEEAQYARDAVSIRREVESAKYTRMQIEKDRIQKDPPGGWAS